MSKKFLVILTINLTRRVLDLMKWLNFWKLEEKIYIKFQLFFLAIFVTYRKVSQESCLLLFFTMPVILKWPSFYVFTECYLTFHNLFTLGRSKYDVVFNICSLFTNLTDTHTI